MTTQHTPGPWVAVARTNAHIEIEAPNQLGYLAQKVASCSLTNHEANARLIAAAPDLLEALKSVQAAIYMDDAGQLRLTRSFDESVIDAAIQKATNKEQA